MKHTLNKKVRGAALVEYGILMGLITVAAIFGVFAIGQSLSEQANGGAEVVIANDAPQSPSLLATSPGLLAPTGSFSYDN